MGIVGVNAMVHAHQVAKNCDVLASGRRRGNEKLLRGGLAIDLLFITGEYHGGVDTDHDGVIEENEKVPSEFICPITGRPMADPVLAADGHMYDRKAIQGMFATNMKISPVTGEPMANRTLEAAPALEQKMQTWVAKMIEEEEFHNMADKDGDGITSEEEKAREWANRFEEKYGDGHQGAASLSAVKFKFYQLDKDKSGELDAEEAVQLAEFIACSFGATGANASAEAAALIERLDMDHDGHIGFDEFEEFYKEKAAEAAEYSAQAGEGHVNLLELGEDLACHQDDDPDIKILSRILTGSWVEDPDTIFHMLDRDRTGRVSAKNLYDLLLFIEFPGASMEMAQGMLEDVDGQHDVRDGQITLQEFKSSFQRSFLEPGEGRKFVPVKQWANPAKS